MTEQRLMLVRPHLRKQWLGRDPEKRPETPRGATWDATAGRWWTTVWVRGESGNGYMRTLARKS